MYKTLNLNNQTFLELQELSTNLGLPKTKVVANLVKNFRESQAKKDISASKEFYSKYRNMAKTIIGKTKKKISIEDLDIGEAYDFEV